VVTEGAVARLLAFIRAHAEIGVVGGRLYYPDGALQETARGFPTMVNALFGRRSWLTRLYPRNPFVRHYLMTERKNETEWFETDWVSAACMMIDRRAFEAVGGFDRHFFVYWSDADFCFRVRAAGYRVACMPAARVIHYERYQTGRRKNPRMIVDFHRGVYQFYTRNYAPSRLHPLRLAALLGLGVRAGLLLTVNACRPRHAPAPRAATPPAPAPAVPGEGRGGRS